MIVLVSCPLHSTLCASCIQDIFWNRTRALGSSTPSLPLDITKENCWNLKHFCFWSRDYHNIRALCRRVFRLSPPSGGLDSREFEDECGPGWRWWWPLKMRVWIEYWELHSMVTWLDFSSYRRSLYRRGYKFSHWISYIKNPFYYSCCPWQNNSLRSKPYRLLESCPLIRR